MASSLLQRASQNEQDFYRAGSDAAVSGSFNSWNPGAAPRLTSDYFPGGRQLEEAAEELVSEIEGRFRQDPDERGDKRRADA